MHENESSLIEWWQRFYWRIPTVDQSRMKGRRLWLQNFGWPWKKYVVPNGPKKPLPKSKMSQNVVIIYTQTLPKCFSWEACGCVFSVLSFSVDTHGSGGSWWHCQSPKRGRTHRQSGPADLQDCSPSAQWLCNTQKYRHLITLFCLAFSSSICLSLRLLHTFTHTQCWRNYSSLPSYQVHHTGRSLATVKLPLRKI